MTDTLLREFEEWLKHAYEPIPDWNLAIATAQKKLEELKKKYKIE